MLGTQQCTVANKAPAGGLAGQLLLLVTWYCLSLLQISLSISHVNGNQTAPKICLKCSITVSQDKKKEKKIFRDSLSRGHVQVCLSHSPGRLVVNHACNIWPARTQSVCWMWAVISLRRV